MAIDELFFLYPRRKEGLHIEGEFFIARDFSREWINGKEIVRISSIQVYGDRRASLFLYPSRKGGLPRRRRIFHCSRLFSRMD